MRSWCDGCRGCCGVRLAWSRRSWSPASPRFLVASLLGMLLFVELDESSGGFVVQANAALPGRDVRKRKMQLFGRRIHGTDLHGGAHQVLLFVVGFGVGDVPADDQSP